MEWLVTQKILQTLELVRSESSLVYASLLFASFGFMTAWLTSGSIILQDKLQLSYMGFGYCALFVGLFYFLSSYFSSKYVKTVGELYLISLGIRFFLFAPIIMLTTFFVSTNFVVISLLITSVAVGFAGAGLIIPNAYSLGVKSFTKIAGMAGAFFGFAQMFGGCIYSYFISFLSTHTVFPLLISMIGTLIIVTFAMSNSKEHNVLVQQLRN